MYTDNPFDVIEAIRARVGVQPRLYQKGEVDLDGFPEAFEALLIKDKEFSKDALWCFLDNNPEHFDEIIPGMYLYVNKKFDKEASLFVLDSLMLVDSFRDTACKYLQQIMLDWYMLTESEYWAELDRNGGYND